MKWFHRNRKRLFLFVIAIFVVGSFAGFGSYFFSQSPLDAAILVNSRRIPYKRFESIYQQILETQRERSPEPLTDAQRNYLKNQAAQILIQQEVFLMEGEALGIRVADAELARAIEAVPAFQRDGRFDVQTYQQVLARMRMKVEDFEPEQRQQILAQKTQYILASGVKISSLELPSKMQAVLASLKEEDQKKLLENKAEFQEDLRRQEVQATLQEWYNEKVSNLKIKVLLSKLEGSSKPVAAGAPPPAPQ